VALSTNYQNLIFTPLNAKEKHSLRGIEKGYKKVDGVVRVKKPRLETIARLKAKTWQWVSIYVRTRGADWKGYNTCVTCGKRDHWRRLQAGHFIPGRRNSIIFDFRHIYPQCQRCNVFLHGNLINYYPYMVKRVGESVIEELKQLNNQDKQFRREELLDIINKCKQATKQWMT
jgi:hypothetical protein